MSEHGWGKTLVKGWVWAAETEDGKIYERYLVAARGESTAHLKGLVRGRQKGVCD